MVKILKAFTVLLTAYYLLLTNPVFAQAAPDPIRLATGARPLGMGKAYVGLADDVGAIFMNPAGLANPNRWQVTSMSGKFIEEYNYLSFSGLYPTRFGNLGLAYVSSNAGGALPTTIEAGSDPSDPIYIVDTSQEQMSYYNNVLILSYGDKLSRFLNLPLLSFIGDRLPGLKGVNFGANLKFFSVNLTGDGITNGSGNGNELDLGLQGQPLSWLSLGSNLRNALPTSLGGKLRFTSGWEENYPAVLKLGLAADLLGPQNAIRKLGGHRVKLLIDYDYEVSRSQYIDPLFHVGLDWRPLNLISLRAGIDQEMISKGNIANNLTGGVGLYFGDFRFDYAYHQFESAPGLDNHFFSLSYGVTPAKVITDPLVSSPDKVTTRQSVIEVKGQALAKKIVTVKVNGFKVAMSPRGEFKTRVSLKLGKNSVMVEGLDSQGKSVATDKLRILRLITYPDVRKNYWAADQISYVGTLGIIKGYPDGSFKPDGNITRAELATLLIRTQAGGDEKVPAAASAIFPDVPLRHWAVKYVNLASRDGIVKGYPNGTFKPSANVTRAEGLTMIARFGQVKERTYNNEFKDVTAKHWAATIIAGAFKENMLIYLKADPFEPSRKLTRAEAVEMLYRTKPVRGLINDLLDFEQGY